jgi:hypothetical protein
MKKVYTDEYWELVRQHLMGDTNTNITMRKITNKSPNRLSDMEFNIPLFNADTQMYLCTNVDEVSTSGEGKDYNISLSEVKQKYSVPERIDISLFIPHTDANGEPARIVMVEVRPLNRRVPLTKVMVTKSKLSSLAGLKEVFYNMAKSM